MEEGHRLMAAVAIMSVVALRLLWLTERVRRRSPRRPAEGVLPREQWQVLHRMLHKMDTVPASPPGLAGGRWADRPNSGASWPARLCTESLASSHDLAWFLSTA